MEADELTALRAEAQRAVQEETFLQNELTGFMQAVQQRQTQEQQTAARECVKQLNDQASPNYIENWSDKYYDELRGFAVTNGVPAQIVNTIVDAPIIKLLDMAMKYHRSQSKAPENKVVTKIVNKTPKKVIKQATAPAGEINEKPDQKKDRAKIVSDLRKRGGGTDAATDAFLALMKSGQDD